jgi:hypothetical protein
MRIWSLHPKYLDAKGLVALWREALLAKNVSEGRTKGYKNHPQLERFKNTANPIDCINQYLMIVYEESVVRGYKFDRRKLPWDVKTITMTVTNGQLNFEADHLLKKLIVRNTKKFKVLQDEKEIDTHPLFRIVDGDIADWERF